MQIKRRKDKKLLFASMQDMSRDVVVLRLSLLLVLGLALHLLAANAAISDLVLFAIECGIYAIIIVIAETLSALRTNPGRQAVVTTSAMVGLVIVAGLTVTGPAVYMLLLIPVVHSALRLSYRHTLITTVCIGCVWAFLRSLDEQQSAVQAFSLLADLLPLVLVALIVKTLSGDVASARSRITALSYQDELTGLLNMRAFTRLMQSEHQKAEITRTTYALLMIDIQDLQSVNECYGHEQGNRVLVAVADALKRSIRSADFVARYGGDEFLIFLSGADKEAAQEICNRVNQNVYNITLSFERKMQRLKVNVGIAVYPDSGATIQQVMSLADRDMYRDKEFQRKTARPAQDSGNTAEGRLQARIESWD